MFEREAPAVPEARVSRTSGDRPRHRLRLRWSVRTRILAAMLTVTAVGMAAAGATAYLVQRDRILQNVDAELLQSVESVRTVVEGVAPSDGAQGEARAPSTPGFASVDAALEAVLSRVLPSGNESSLGVVGGKPRFVSSAQVNFHLEDEPGFVDRVVAEVADGTVRLGTHVGELGKLRYIAVPVSVADTPGEGVFITAVELDAELGEITTAFRTYALVAALSLMAVGWVGWFVAGRLLWPIRALRETASRITGSDLRERIPVTGNDDVSALTTTINEMLQRLDDARRAQGQLLDDVRHELKTPVTIVRGHLELLDPHDAADVAETRELLLDELERMTSLIDDIELLASSQGLHIDLQSVSPRELSEQIFAKASAIVGPLWSLDLSGIQPSHDAAKDEVALDAPRITQAVLQLADNAAKYSAGGSPIVLGCSRHGADVHFWVADQGPGIAPEAQSRVFERFGRADTGRGVEGSGLGLPIVAAIAAAHGGRVSLSSSPLGSRFTIEIPTTEPQEAQ